MLNRQPASTFSTRHLLQLVCAGVSAVSFGWAGASDYPPPPGPYQSGPAWGYEVPAAATSDPMLPQDADNAAAGSRPLPLPSRHSAPRPGAYDAANLFGTAAAREPSAGPAETAPALDDPGVTADEPAGQPPAVPGASYFGRGAPGYPGRPQYPPVYRGRPAFSGQMPYAPFPGQMPRPTSPSGTLPPPGPPLQPDRAVPGAEEAAGSRFRSAPAHPETRGAAESGPPPALNDTAGQGAAGAATFRPADLPAGY